MAAETNRNTNLCSHANGAHILFATDEWFATSENLLNPYPPTFVPDLFCEQGKVMDGWETRRKRTAGHDWCVVQLGCGDGNGSMGEAASFMLNSIAVDTAYFTGNQTPKISIEAIKVERPNTSGDDIIDNNDYLYNWMPGAITRIARGGGIRGTGQSPSSIQNASQACQKVALQSSRGQTEKWILILPMTPLKPGYEESRHHSFSLSKEVIQKLEEMGGVTHLKLNYFPDGGVARLKVWGSKFAPNSGPPSAGISSIPNNPSVPKIHPHSTTTSSNPLPSSTSYPHPELSSELSGGIGLECSNKHYGVPSNLLRPTLGKDMGDGWETARHPDRPPIVTKDSVTGLQDTPLMDWAVLKLGLGGVAENDGVSRIIVDTRHFKGNFPESVSIDGCYADPKSVSDEQVCGSAGVGSDDKKVTAAVEWFPLLKRTSLTADAEHEFLRDFGYLANGRRAVTHVRVSIFPDGGLSRVRVYGSPTMGNARSHL